MTIALEPELENALTVLAKKEGLAPEQVVVRFLRERLLSSIELVQPQDEWERGLLKVGRDCGVSLSNRAVSSEGLYE